MMMTMMVVVVIFNTGDRYESFIYCHAGCTAAKLSSFFGRQQNILLPTHR